MNFLKLKKIDVEMDDTTIIRDTEPRTDLEYTLMIKVGLKDKRVTNPDSEDSKTEFLMDYLGTPSLVPIDFGRENFFERAEIEIDEPLEGPQLPETEDKAV